MNRLLGKTGRGQLFRLVINKKTERSFSLDSNDMDGYSKKIFTFVMVV